MKFSRFNALHNSFADYPIWINFGRRKQNHVTLTKDRSGCMNLRTRLFVKNDREVKNKKKWLWWTVSF